MEKIQKALEKAKARREQSGVETAASQPDMAAQPAYQAPADTQAATSPDDVDKRWQAIKMVKLDDRKLAKNRIVTRDSRGHDTMYYDQLRTRIRTRMRENDWYRIGVTSPSAACGKTTTALNLAFSAARNKETRVVFIDMDLRRPAASNALNIEGFQFSRSLTDHLPYTDEIVRVQENMIVGLNDRIVRDPAEVMQSAHTADVIARMQDELQPDLMIFDLPPDFVADDVAAFSDKLHAVMIVAAAGRTTVDEVDRCEQSLSEQTKIMGVVLNKCRYMGKDYGYKYYYA